MARRAFVIAASVWLPASHAQAGCLNVPQTMTDQQANSALAAIGNPYLATPAMDSLAVAGVSFVQSYATYPVCSPARGSLMTGRVPHEAGGRVLSACVSVAWLRAP